MNKHIATRIRETEEIVKWESVVAWVKNSSRECYVALICHKSSEFELG